MNSRNECERCRKNEAHQSFAAKSRLLKDEGIFEKEDLYHGRSMIYLCKQCSTEIFKIIDQAIIIDHE